MTTERELELLRKIEALVIERDRVRAALSSAETEIKWWVSEHGCCRGHEDDALEAIKSAQREPA